MTRVRPLARLLLTIPRPARVRMRSRKPWVLARRRLFGWNVRFDMVTPKSCAPLVAPRGLGDRWLLPVRLAAAGTKSGRPRGDGISDLEYPVNTALGSNESAVRKIRKRAMMPDCTPHPEATRRAQGFTLKIVARLA